LSLRARNLSSYFLIQHARSFRLAFRLTFFANELRLKVGNPGALLLNRVHQLVCKQTPAGVGVRSELLFAKYDVRPDGVRQGMNGTRRFRCVLIRVDPDTGKVPSEAGLEISADGFR
jgi:hypothetical protein